MALIVSVFTIGSGELVLNVFNAVAAIFNVKSSIGALTHIAIMLGGFCATLQFTKSHDIQTIIRWLGMYVLVTVLILSPKATVAIEDRMDIKPRSVDNVPLSLAVVASFTSRIGIGMAELVEMVFHMPGDLSYNQTGMLMGSRLVLASEDFQITDPVFSQTLDAFMQQCVFYDLLLDRYTINDITHDKDPWKFIKEHTSVARAFPLNGQITICKIGAVQLDAIWQQTLNNAATIYGAQILGNSIPQKIFLSRLSDGYNLLTNVSEEGADILKKHLLSNSMMQAVAHTSANTNAPAALQAFEDAKTELQVRHTLDLTGRQAGYWLQQIKNIVEAVMYGAFIFIYFLSYFPFGGRIVSHYLFGLFYLQTLAPMFAIVNFAATFYAQNRSLIFSSDEGLSIANMAGITQANADAMALAGYLGWIIALGGGVMLFKGWTSGIQSAGQYFGGVFQNAATHVSAEAIGGNMSVGNTNFDNHSAFNTNANHFDTNARHASGMVSFQTGAGSTVSVSPDGREILNTQGSISNLPVDIRVAESTREMASTQYQTSVTTALSKMHAAGSHYATALRQVDDFGNQSSHFENSGINDSHTKSSGFSRSASDVHNIMETYRKDHNITHEKNAQLFGEIYAEAHGGLEVLGEGGKVGGSVRASGALRSSFGSLYSEAEQYAKDHHFTDAVDNARRDARESHYRVSDDSGNRFSQSISRSFDQGDSLRKEATSNYSQAQSYASLATQSTENSTSINANYGQEFYQWIRTQSPIHRHGGSGSETMSRSMIDNMSISDLQQYADRFSNEKSSQIISTFNETHHLDTGKSEVFDTYSRNNQSLENLSDIKNKDHHYQQVVNHETEHHNTGHIDRSVSNTVSNFLAQDDKTYHDIVASDDHQGSNVELQTREKVKGQVFGSFTPIIKAEKWAKEDMGEHE